MSRDMQPPEVVTIATPSLGDRSYLLISGDAAAAADPQRDVDRFESVRRVQGPCTAIWAAGCPEVGRA